jgi:hypothetical protein
MTQHKTPPSEMLRVLESERSKLTTQEFISYTRNRDPRSFGWEYRQDGLYHPVGQ